MRTPLDGVSIGNVYKFLVIPNCSRKLTRFERRKIITPNRRSYDKQADSANYIGIYTQDLKNIRSKHPTRSAALLFCVTLCGDNFLIIVRVNALEVMCSRAN